MSAVMPGTLLLVPNTLDLGVQPQPLDEVLPTAVLRRAAAVRHWAVENAKTARALLKRVDAVTPLALPLRRRIHRRPRRAATTFAV